MAAAHDRAPADAGSLRGITQRRLIQAIQLSLGAACLLAFSAALAGVYSNAVILCGLIVVLVVALRLARNDRIVIGMTMLLSIAVAAVGLIITLNQGLRDGAVPGVYLPLVFAAMLGSRRGFLLTLAAIVVLFVSVGVTEMLGIHHYPVRPVSWNTMIAAVAITCAVAVTVWLMAGDLREALMRAEQEGRKARQSQAEVEAMAHLDVLTGLPNRMALLSYFEHAAAQARHHERRLAMLYLDLDTFKVINDSLGHEAGDELLRRVAWTLRSTVDPRHAVGRIGGDEFMILLGDLSPDESVSAIAEAIMRSLGNSEQIAGVDIHATCSMGIAIYPDDGITFGELMKNADTAMYVAKDAGKNAFRLYEPTMDAGVADTLQLIAGIRAGLEQGQFALHYQPQFDLSSGAVIGAEALLRWQHPELGAISPVRFIPAAERSGLIVRLGNWVLEETCRQIRAWDSAGLPPLVIAVNLSPVQFKRDDIERVIDTTLAAHGVPPERIELELTESLLMGDSEHTSTLIRRLNARGHAFAIDDFGTGYSNLGYLRRFAVERLKIDQSFVRGVATDAHNAAIITAIVQVARSLDMKIVAEGVEDEETLVRLRALGCDYGQGWLWSRALPADQFAAFVTAHPAGHPAT